MGGAEQPEDWDEEEDGEWEPPMVPNPEFKGEWKAPMIDNPDYKGEWEHPQIDNPDFVDDKNVYASICVVMDAVRFQSISGKLSLAPSSTIKLKQRHSMMKPTL